MKQSCTVHSSAQVTNMMKHDFTLLNGYSTAAKNLRAKCFSLGALSALVLQLTFATHTQGLWEKQ